MAMKETISFILLVVIPVAMMAKQPLMPKASNSEEDKAIVQTKGKCNVTGMKEQIKAIKRKLDNLSTKVESCQPNASCPAGWLRHGSACYYIDDTPTKKQADARTTCQNMGADLHVIRSAAENNFILNLIKNQGTVTEYGAWLGMHRSAADSKFYWFDGTPAQGQQYQNWAPNGPKCLDPQLEATIKERGMMSPVNLAVLGIKPQLFFARYFFQTVYLRNSHKTPYA